MYIYIIYIYIYIYIYILYYIILYIYEQKTEFSGRGFKSHLGQFSEASFKKRSVVNTISISSCRYTPEITSTKLRLNKRCD